MGNQNASFKVYLYQMINKYMIQFSLKLLRLLFLFLSAFELKATQQQKCYQVNEYVVGYTQS